MASIIPPKVLKGFRDIPPETELIRRGLIRRLEDHFQSYAYVPIDTPALEYAEVLLSKGGGESDKQTYRFTDHGGRDVAMRFDLTVPLARYVAAHRNDILLPFRRYHIAKAWRGENTQRGRYREFIQCDFDIVGVDSPAADLEIMLLMSSGLQALDAGDVRIRFSHRGLLNGMLGRLGLSNQSTALLRILDKVEKIGAEEVGRLLEAEAGPRAAQALLDFITPAGDNRETLKKMSRLAGDPRNAAEERVAAILGAVENHHANLVLDPSITRGLDYYTGIVFEAYLLDLPTLGSVCSGGRYNNLTGLFMKDALSGVGAAIGLDRLIAGLGELGRLPDAPPHADVLVMMLDEDLLAAYQVLAHRFRSEGLAVELYPEKKKLAIQFRYAEAKNIPLAVIVGPDEAASETITIKDLRSRQSFEGLKSAEALSKARTLLLG